MATIREDVVSISFDVENNPFAELTAGINEMKAAVGVGVDDSTENLKDIAKEATTAADGVEELADSAKKLGGVKSDGLTDSVKKTTQETQKAQKGFTDMVKSARNMAKIKMSNNLEKIKSIPAKAKGGFDKLKGSLEKIKKIKLSDIGKGIDKALGKGVTSSGKLFTSLKKAASVGFEKVSSGVKNLASYAGNAAGKLAKLSVKGIVTGVGAAATAVGGLVAASVKSYADFEQLTGGVETLFKGSAPAVQKYANDAYKTAGLSANQYMETVTSFSASLLQSVGGDTKKAASMADMAVIDMADNANKMGTSMDTVVETYQSLAKGNYEMLDNLKLGYGGTKTEMQRLIKDAAKIDKSVDANSMSYGNMVKALHAVQTKMGITGTTSKEATETISGSWNGLKAAWGNVLPALIQGGDAFDQTIKNLVDSAVTFGKNIMPAIKSALTGVTQLVSQLAPMIAAEIPALAVQILPQLVNAGISMIQSLINAIQANVGSIASAATQIVTSLAQFLISALPQLIIVGVQLVLALWQGMAQQFPTLIPMFISKLLELVNSLIGMIPQIINAGLQITLGLLQGLIQALPILIGYLPVIMTSLVNGLLQSLPLIIQAAIQLINALVQGLIQCLPLLIQSALQMVQALIQGLIQNMPMIIQAAIQLINGLVTGLLQQLPMIIQMGIQLILSLVQGLIQQIPMLVQAAVQLIVGLATGLLQNIPMIIQAAIQLIIALAGGLIQAIPELIAAIPQIVGAIIEGLMSVDWIQVGKDLIGGVWDGIKSLFKGGKSKGKEAGDSVASGIDESKYIATTSGSNLATSTTNSMQLNNSAISGYGAAGVNNLASGISGNMGTATTAANSLATSTTNSMRLNTFTTQGYGISAGNSLASGITGSQFTATTAGNSLATSTTNSMKLNNSTISGYGSSASASLASGITGNTATATIAANSLATSTTNSMQLNTTGAGANAATGLASGINSNVGTATAAASNMSQQVENAAKTEIKVNIVTDNSGLNKYKASITSLITSTSASLNQLPQIFTRAFSLSMAATTTQMSSINNAVKTGLMKAVATTKTSLNMIKSAIASCNLYSSGVNLMSGFNRGMESMRGTILATARSIAKSAASEIDNALDINSPSRVTTESGEYTGIGFANGITNMKDKVTKAAKGIGTAVSTTIKPKVTAYTPSGSAVSNTSNRNTVNNFNPQFTLNMNGSSATESNKRKVKKWVKESIQETFESLGRVNPELCEV